MSTDTARNDLDEFRQRCVEFLKEHGQGKKITEADPRDEIVVAHHREFLAKMHKAGFTGLQYPVEFGGQGLSQKHERIWREEYGKHSDQTSSYVISQGMCLPIMNQFGTEEQKRTYMPAMISGEDMWCQMFSEPDAGSDVASLQTKAVKDGDQWIITGQKVWTTLAHQSRYGILIARTDPTVVKHAGISMFMVDMSDPAIEIRAIHQIDGGQHFNEVFFNELAIPASWLIGTLNNGWNQATAMLMYERVAIGTGGSGGVSHPYASGLIKYAQKTGRIENVELRQQLMKIYSEEVAKSLVAMRTRAELKAGKEPGPGGSLGKLHSAVIVKQIRSMLNLVTGSELMAWPQDASGSSELIAEYGKDDSRHWTKFLSSSFIMNIAGGTDEIQKNIIGDRVLGLPRDISVDRGVPFNELKLGTQSRNA